MVPDDDDKTRMGGAPPPPKIPGGPPVKTPTEAQDEHTLFPAAPAPPATFRPPATPAAPPPILSAQPSRQAAAAPAGAADATVPPAATAEDATVIITDRARAMVRLQRVQPPGRSEMITLERSTYMLGRSDTCDIALHTPTASREHARLVYRDGQWYVQPFEQHIVLVDGRAVRHEARVTDRMRLQLGDDELVFLDSGSQAAGDAAPGSRTWFLIAGGVGVVVLVAAMWFLFARGG